MRTVIVSCTGVGSGAELIRRTADLLDLGARCGTTLDGLADCLWETPMPLKLILAGLDDNPSIEAAYAARVRHMLAAVSKDIEGFTYMLL